MTAKLRLSRRDWVALGAITLLLSGCAMPSPSPETSGLQTLNYAGSKQPLVALDAEIAAAGNDPARLDALAGRLLALLRDPGTTFAAKQAICERLREFPAASLTGADALQAFRAMLTNEHEIELARLAIERVPGQAVDAVFLDALANATPQTRLALIQSAGNRHLVGAVPILSIAEGDTDAKIVASAAKALGQIGAANPAETAPLAALQHAPQPYAPAVVEAELVILHAEPGRSAGPQFEALSRDEHVPAALRAAAFHGWLTADPDAAPARIAGVLAGNDPVLKPVVLEAIAAHPAPDLTRVLAAQLQSFDPATRAAVIAALGRRADPAATRAIADATSDPDPAVRAAAIVAVAELPGTPETATLLANLTTSDHPAEAKLARQALSRLNGPGVKDAILDGSRNDEPRLRVAFIESLATRNMTEAVPLLLALRDDADRTVRAAALGSLAELAPAAAQPAILDWAVAATDPQEQSRALRAVALVSQRNPDRAAATQTVTDAIERAPAPVAVRLMPVLARLGGEPAAACAVRLAGRGDAALTGAAISALSRWPDPAGASGLVEIATHTADNTQRTDAVRAALRFLDQNRSLASTDLSAAIARLLSATTDPAIRQQLVFLLGRCHDDAALTLAEKFKNDPALSAEAADAALAIRANRAGAPLVSVSTSEYQSRNLLDGKLQTRWSAPSDAKQWVQLDFHASRPVHRVVLEQGKWTDEFPEGIEAFLTDNPNNPGSPRATAVGQSNRTTVNFPAGARGRYLIIRHAGERIDGTWTIAEVLVD